ncbi:MAG: hybrid sensor histidine kinase/response regulator [Pelomonas sp.]|nr:hybrid sensor histidine kinase/response regulator [Roseateles sp.]
MQAASARVHPAEPAAASAPPVQRVVKIRRDYNAWVASETLEDYALRFTPRAARRTLGGVANTAFGAASFLVLEAVGATLLLEYGFANAAWAILATGLVILLAGWPIAVHAARHGLDMDLLTRGAGFGYIGSTITSLIYACFTFVFFALEAAIMAYALELAFGVPPAWGYALCALVVLPLVMHGMTAIARLQAWTQPLWLALLILPYAAVVLRRPGLGAELAHLGGGFTLGGFGAALTVGMALITQMGEQADYLRFMPPPRPGRRGRWWAAVFVGGPGWVIPGVAKMFGGALLACLALSLGVARERAVDPNQLYLAGFGLVFDGLPTATAARLAVAATALFVVVSQLKINVTNAYAGSLAWSNFFARLTHSHPGRVVWVVFNTAIALLLMEMDLFRALDRVLGLYANVAIAWIMSVVADLVVNKPLGLSPREIEFRRAKLYDVNPVGVGAMALASLVSIAAHLSAFGTLAQSFSAAIAAVVALATAPLIAWATQGRYYLARPTDEGAYLGTRRCVVCERDYEGPEMAHCPAYRGAICSLCCALDARCEDLCKPDARASAQARALLRRLLPRRAWPLLDAGLARYLGLMAVVLPLLGLGGVLLYRAQLALLGAHAVEFAPALRAAWTQGLVAVLLGVAVAGWWLVLNQQSRRVAQEESRRQAQLLGDEIAAHRRTDAQLQQALARAAAASAAKTRYINTMSHELRTPLNAILGYALILDEDARMPAHRRQAVKVIRRGGEHLLALIEGSLDLARIEAGRLRVEPGPWALAESLRDLQRLFASQAEAKGLGFELHGADALPAWVRGDAMRVQQVLINLVGNAIKFTERGQVRVSVRHAGEIARVVVEDSGPGMAAAELERVFEPFERGDAARAPGTGLGLTIAKMLTELMGGALEVSSAPGQGTRFTLRLYLPVIAAPAVRAAPPAARPPERAAEVALPPRDQLLALQQALARGHVKGVLGLLDAIAAADPGCAPFVARLRELASEFRLDALSQAVARGLHEGLHGELDEQR